jgi:hypothetical protein
MASSNSNNGLELKNAFQKNILVIAKEFLLKHKWLELIECMKLLNIHLSRQYIHVYWKVSNQRIHLTKQ